MKQYRVIADYPNSPFSVGEILYETEHCGKPLFVFSLNDGIDWMDEEQLKMYPHLFKRIDQVQVGIIGGKDNSGLALKLAKETLKERGIEIVNVENTGIAGAYMKYQNELLEEYSALLEPSRGTNKTKPQNIDTTVHTVLPNGCKWYYFTKEGEMYEYGSNSAFFKCIASSEKSAKKKFEKYIKQ
jgi:hypothetical protein